MILLIDNDLLIGFPISDYRLVRLGLELPVRHRKSDHSEYTGFKFPALFKKPRYLLVFLYRFTASFEEKQPVMGRILSTVAIAGPYL